MKYMTAEEAAEAAKGLTFEKVWTALVESRQRMEENSREMKEFQPASMQRAGHGDGFCVPAPKWEERTVPVSRPCTSSGAHLKPDNPLCVFMELSYW